MLDFLRQQIASQDVHDRAAMEAILAKAESAEQHESGYRVKCRDGSVHLLWAKPVKVQWHATEVRPDDKAYLDEFLYGPPTR